MKSVFYIIYSVFYSVLAGAEAVDCVDGQIRNVEYKNKVILKESYCYDLNSKAISSTKKCASTCLSENLDPLLVKRKYLQSEIASPLFQICKLARGAPQDVEYLAEKEWITTSRCLFNDGSFIDINHLISNRVKYED